MRLTTKSQYGLRVLGDLVHNWRDAEMRICKWANLPPAARLPRNISNRSCFPSPTRAFWKASAASAAATASTAPPDDISLAEALRHLEGLLMPIPKWADDSSGDNSQLGDVLRRVRSAIRDILEHTSIEVLAEGGAESKERADEAVETLMYYI